jgi:hypothetical protein
MLEISRILEVSIYIISIWDKKVNKTTKKGVVLLEVKINREIRDYQESIFFGLNLRQLIFSVLAVAVAVGIYFGLRHVIGTETVSWLCILGAVPFGAMGFVRYNGMSAEQFVAAYIKSEILCPKHLCFDDENIYYLILKERAKGRVLPGESVNKKKDHHKGGKKHD